MVKIWRLRTYSLAAHCEQFDPLCNALPSRTLLFCGIRFPHSSFSSPTPRCSLIVHFQLPGHFSLATLISIFQPLEWLTFSLIFLVSCPSNIQSHWIEETQTLDYIIAAQTRNLLSNLAIYMG